jgi:hypothetical protein
METSQTARTRQLPNATVPPINTNNCTAKKSSVEQIQNEAAIYREQSVLAV